MGSINNDHIDIDMLKTGNITLPKTPSVYKRDEYYTIEECKDGVNLHEIPNIQRTTSKYLIKHI